MIPAGIRLRPLGPFDIAVCAAIHKDAFGFEAWDEKAIAEVLAMPRTVGRMAVDAKAGDIIPLGFALEQFVADDAELLTIAVPHAVRRQGVALALMEDFFALARLRRATNAFLEVAEDNVPAQKLYARLGFHQEGRRPDYYQRPGNKRVAAHLLRRPID